MYTKISPVPNSSKKIERLEKSIGLKIEENNLLNIKIKKTESPHFRLQALHSSEKTCQDPRFSKTSRSLQLAVKVDARAVLVAVQEG